MGTYLIDAWQISLLSTHAWDTWKERWGREWRRGRQGQPGQQPPPMQCSPPSTSQSPGCNSPTLWRHFSLEHCHKATQTRHTKGWYRSQQHHHGWWTEPQRGDCGPGGSKLPPGVSMSCLARDDTPPPGAENEKQLTLFINKLEFTTQAKQITWE